MSVEKESFFNRELSWLGFARRVLSLVDKPPGLAGTGPDGAEAARSAEAPGGLSRGAARDRCWRKEQQ